MAKGDTGKAKARQYMSGYATGGMPMPPRGVPGAPPVVMPVAPVAPMAPRAPSMPMQRSPAPKAPPKPPMRREAMPSPAKGFRDGGLPKVAGGAGGGLGRLEKSKDAD